MKTIKIALIGQPNVGKSSLINALCGSNMKVGNFTGVTVEKAYAKTKFENYEIQITDLPGTYSLYGYSQEEKIVRQFLENEDYDLIINVADSTNLERNLLLTAQLLELQKKLVVALNMSDEAKKEGVSVDVKMLSELLGAKCVSVSANQNTGLDELLKAVTLTYEAAKGENKRIYGNEIETEILKIEEFLNSKGDKSFAPLSTRQAAILLLKQDEEFYKTLHAKPIWLELGEVVKASLNNLYIAYDTKSSDEIFAQDLNAFCAGIATETIKYETKQKINYTKAIDNILINKYIGVPIFLGLMWLLFWLTFTLGEIPMDYIETAFGFLGEKVKESVSNELLASLLADGIINGVGAVILFLPNIVILFIGISLLETTGYMSRVAFLLDGFFHKFGLHGKSFIPLVTGFGCSVPAFMVTRTLKTKKDRLLTLFIINFMSCGARLPIYVLFVGAFFPASQAGNWLFAIYILGAIVGLVLAKVLRLTAFKGADEPFVMEMPKYRLPNLRLVWFSVYTKAKMYVKKAGTFILAATVLIWFMSSFPSNDAIKDTYDVAIEQATTEVKKQELEFALQERLLEESYIGKLGKFVEPVFAPLGFDWKMSVALLTGLAAKEVVVSTTGVLYSLGGDVAEDDTTLMEILRENIPLKAAVSFVLFVMFYNPCLAATIVFAKEAGGARYGVYLFLFTTLVAYLAALVANILLTIFL